MTLDISDVTIGMTTNESITIPDDRDIYIKSHVAVIPDSTVSKHF
jgi:hypothetical protein